MLQLGLRRGDESPLRILCLGAHSDDLEIGCGGTLLKLLRSGRATAVHWVVFSASDERAAEARASAREFLEGTVEANVEIEAFRDGFFPYAGAEIKQWFENLKGRCAPDVIFTHYRDDRHQDHRLISDLTWNTFRNHLVFEYEIPKYDGDLGRPNVFVHLDAAVSGCKVEKILRLFPTQRTRPWFTEDAFLSLLRLRGIESAAPDRYAEAFFCRKAVLTAEIDASAGETHDR